MQWEHTAPRRLFIGLCLGLGLIGCEPTGGSPSDTPIIIALDTATPLSTSAPTASPEDASPASSPTAQASTDAALTEPEATPSSSPPDLTEAGPTLPMGPTLPAWTPAPTDAPEPTAAPTDAPPTLPLWTPLPPTPAPTEVVIATPAPTSPPTPTPTLVPTVPPEPTDPIPTPTFDPDLDDDGIPNDEEGDGDIDGDGVPNYEDDDSDGDGISDVEEGAGDTDGDGTPDYQDDDSDGDGILDADEGEGDSDGDGIPDYQDDDSDGDGIPDADEGEGDSDNDGVPDFQDPDSDTEGGCDGYDDDGDGQVDEGHDLNGNGIADCFEQCPITLHFEEDAWGVPVRAGQDLSESYSPHGIHIEVWKGEGNNTPGRAIAFDSSHPTGDDWDLGSPNEVYGGPGRGSGGPATNDTPLGNVLISAENVDDFNHDGYVDDPDDEGEGSLIKFHLDIPLCLYSVVFMDIEEGSQASSVRFYDANGGFMRSVPAEGYGDNSVQTLDYYVCGVSTVVFDMYSSGAMDEVTFCPQAPDGGGGHGPPGGGPGHGGGH